MRRQESCSGQLRPVGLSRERNIMAEQLRNRRGTQGLDGSGGELGPSLSHLHSPVCLSNQVLSSMTQMTQRDS